MPDSVAHRVGARDSASSHHGNIAGHGVGDAAGLWPSSLWVPQHQLAVGVEAGIGCSSEQHSPSKCPSQPTFVHVEMIPSIEQPDETSGTSSQQACYHSVIAFGIACSCTAFYCIRKSGYR